MAKVIYQTEPGNDADRRLFNSIRYTNGKGGSVGFDILMVMALGSLAGTGIGILIAYAAKKQKSEWSAMSRNEQSITIALVITLSAIFCVGMGYYFLV